MQETATLQTLEQPTGPITQDLSMFLTTGDRLEQVLLEPREGMIGFLEVGAKKNVPRR